MPTCVGTVHLSNAMAVPPSIRKSIQSIRAFIASGGGEKTRDLSPYVVCHPLFRDPGRILENEETLDAVLELVPEIEAYRGKGSQILQKDFHRGLGGLVFHGRSESFEAPPEPDLFSTGSELPDPPSPPPFWAEKLSDYFFEQVRGKPARSYLAARMRFDAWLTLGELCDFCRRSAYLSSAIEVAADKRRPDAERDGAIQFLAAYWADEDPDKATIDLLESLREDPPNRDFLVTVLQAQIELGLNDEMGALFDVEGWDDAEYEGEEK